MIIHEAQSSGFELSISESCLALDVKPKRLMQMAETNIGLNLWIG
jgi:hypothetical protein